MSKGFMDKIYNLMGFEEEIIEEKPKSNGNYDKGNDSGSNHTFSNHSNNTGSNMSNNNSNHSSPQGPSNVTEGVFTRKKAPAPVVPINSAAQQKQMKVIVVEPKHFDDAKAIADHLKNRRQVVINLEKADHVLAQRVIDFVSGTTYALNGSMQKVGTGIFLFVPSNVDIASDLEETMTRPAQLWQSLGTKG